MHIFHFYFSPSPHLSFPFKLLAKHLNTQTLSRGVLRLGSLRRLVEAKGRQSGPILPTAGEKYFDCRGEILHSAGERYSHCQGGHYGKQSTRSRRYIFPWNFVLQFYRNLTKHNLKKYFCVSRMIANIRHELLTKPLGCRKTYIFSWDNSY